ncbi:hypothetical protein KM043_004135 [Ampulex compressa]|nr:hypothetical protein KM043_004135 [Ampulex compressa]
MKSLLMEEKQQSQDRLTYLKLLGNELLLSRFMQQLLLEGSGRELSSYSVLMLEHCNMENCPIRLAPTDVNSIREENQFDGRFVGIKGIRNKRADKAKAYWRRQKHAGWMINEHL